METLDTSGQATDGAEQTADAEIDRLARWLIANVPDAVGAGSFDGACEGPVDVAIRILTMVKTTMPIVAQIVAQQIVTPVVLALRQAGFDVLPDGLTIPAERGDPGSAAPEPYVLDLVDALLRCRSGQPHPLDFHGHPVPAAVRDRLEAAHGVGE